MLKLTSVVLLLVLCSAHGFTYRALLQRRAEASSGSSASSTDGGSASASAAATSRGGTARAVATATSEAFSEARDEIVVICVRIFNDDTFIDCEEGAELDDCCLSAYSVYEDDILAIAEVTAEAYATAEVIAEVDGEGEACGDAEAAARAQAEGYAEILLSAIVEAAGEDEELAADAEIEVNQRIELIATAFATAWASACAGDDSSATAFTESFANAIGYPTAHLFISLIAGVDCRASEAFDDVYAEATNFVVDDVFAQSITETDTEGDARADAEGDAGAELRTRCTGMYRICCSGDRAEEDTCGCTLGSGAPRCNANRVEESDPVQWDDEENDVYCTC